MDMVSLCLEQMLTVYCITFIQGRANFRNPFLHLLFFFNACIGKVYELLCVFANLLVCVSQKKVDLRLERF